MRSLIYIFVIIFPFLIIQCSNQIPNSANQNGLELGKVSLRIDKQNAPSGVVLVEAYLTREGYDSLYGALNILSSNSADISFDDVAAGDWHLEVDAKDNNGVVLYSGEADMIVQAGILTQVNLVLTPTGLGTGYIYIYVSWGTNNTGWIDFKNNPVLRLSNTYWDFQGVREPKILIENGIYKMWYLGLANSSRSNVGYATSSDGISWTKPYDYPVLTTGQPGSWDETAAIAGVVMKDSSVYKMYYFGWSDPYGTWNIGLATSTDGINWTKYPSPILYGTTGWETRIAPSSILKINGMYYMYYYSNLVEDNKIGLATSSDGINWTRYSGNPILEATQPWEGTGIYYPSVMKDSGIYKMIYMNKGDSFGIATSPDGINWTKETNNPFFTKENTANKWGDEDIAYPFFMKNGNEYRIYYSGIGVPGSDIYSIGFTSKHF